MNANLPSPFLALPDPPYNVTATGLSPFSIGLTWKFNQTSANGLNISSFFVFIRKLNSAIGSWSVIGVPHYVSSFNVTDLQAITTYRIRMSVALTFANGPGSEEVLATTSEGGKHSKVLLIVIFSGKKCSHLLFLFSLSLHLYEHEKREIPLKSTSGKSKNHREDQSRYGCKPYDKGIVTLRIRPGKSANVGNQAGSIECN